MKPQPFKSQVGQWLWERRPNLVVPFHPDLNEEYYPGTKLQHVSPYGQPGDQLWVRESWAYHPDGKDKEILYRATDSGWDDNNTGLRWKPSIHMPRWASRIQLEVTDVRVERVQEISEEDAKAEGISDGGCLNCGNSSDPEACGCDYPKPDFRDSFANLWDSINAKRGYSWESNPYVWVVEFERVTP